MANYTSGVDDLVNYIKYKFINESKLPENDFVFMQIAKDSLTNSSQLFDAMTFELNQLLAWRLQQLYQKMLLAILFVIVCTSIGLVYGMYVMFNLSKSLTALIDTTPKPAPKDSSPSALLLSKDEVGQVSQSFNQMADVIEGYSKELEDKVTKRTLALKEKVNELQVMQRQIITQEKMASLGSLTAGIAHEIKNPLNFIMNFSQLSEKYVASPRHSSK